VIRFSCPSCGTILSAPEAVAGMAAKCRGCGQAVTVPSVASGGSTPPRDKTALGRVISHKPTAMQTTEPAPASTGSSQGSTRQKRAPSRAPAAHSPESSRAPRGRWPLGCVVGGVLAFLSVGAVAVLLAYAVYTHLETAKEKDVEAARASRSKGDTSSTVIIEDIPDGGNNDKFPPPDEEKQRRKPKDSAPGPKPKPKDPAPGPKPKPAPEDRDLAPIISRLRNGTAEERIEAAETLGSMGIKARPACRALCEAATDSSQKVSRAALVALEKIDPDLQKPIFVLLIDGQAANHIQALGKLDELGDKGRAGVPVVVHQIDKCTSQLNEQIEGRFGRGGTAWGSLTLFEVIERNMLTLTKIGPEEPQTVKTLTSLAKFQTQQPVFFSRRAGKEFVQSHFPFRPEAVALLGDVAEKRPEH
jgi:hypothetical protein